MFNRYSIISTLLCYALSIGVTFSQSRTRGSNSGPLVSQTPQWQAVLSEQPAPASVQLLSSDINHSVVKLEIPGFWMVPAREVNGEMEFIISADESSPILALGAPDLSKVTASLVIPDLNDMQVSIISSAYTDFNDILIAPSKGNITRNMVPSEVPFEYGPVYQQDSFYPGQLAELRDPYVMRDVRGQAAVFYPIQYNPVTRILRVYHTLTVELSAIQGAGTNPLTNTSSSGSVNREYVNIYSHHFLNYGQYQQSLRYSPVEEDGNMLIICHGAFMTSMQPLVEWKTARGLPVEMVDVASIGGAENIKTYVQNYYNTNGLTYLLLVGDNAQVPAYPAPSGASDNYYGYVAGNDHYPDVFVGRFSAENAAQVQTQVQRTIDYEKNSGPADGHYSRSVCIGSAEGPGDDGEYDWQHQRGIRTDEMGYLFEHGSELYDGSQGGADATGNPTSTMLSSEINTGAGILTYTGHGNTTTWGTTGYSTYHINTYLSNTGRLPMIISVSCLSGNFTNTTCFAETWMRATYNNNPKGAIAVLMSTINQAWSPPMDGQDEMIDILTESYANNIKRTFGGICMNGCMKMNDSYGSSGYVETDTWALFGDPSLLVRTDAPEFVNVVHNAYVPLGTSQLQVQCDRDGALIVLTNGNQIISSQAVSGGTVTFQFDPVTQPDTMKVTMTDYNAQSYQGTVVFTNAAMTYVSSETIQKDTNGVAPGTPNADIVCLKVKMAGLTSPQSVTSLRFNLNGTTSINDISQVKVYYTGLDPVFNPSSLFATAQPSTSTIVVSGNQQLTGGDNYFWIASDIVSTAPIGNLIDAECIRVTVSGSQKTPSVTAPAGNREIDIMEFQDVLAIQAGNGYVNPGAQNVPVLRVKITTTGSPSALTLQNIDFNLDGISNLGDVDNVDVYYSGADTVFSSNDQLIGSFSPANGTISFGCDHLLAEGGNNFWLAFDVSSTATYGGILDAACEGILIDNTVYQAAIPDPEGSVRIEPLYCMPVCYYGTSYGDYISRVSLQEINNNTLGSISPYYNLYGNAIAQLSKGETYNLVLSAGSVASGNRLAAWIDYDLDGVFENWEKLGEVSVGAKPATCTISFSIPDSAGYGIMRMRVRESFNMTDIDPCNAIYYGETEDYRVEVFADGLWLGNSNDWDDPSNWFNGQVPDQNTSVIIPPNALGGNLPTVFSGASPQCKDIHIGSGVNMVLPTGVTFTVHGEGSN